MKTFPPKTVLVAFDFSKRSMRAWRYAQALAQRVGASMQAVYVSPWVLNPEGVMIPLTLTPEDRLKLEKKLQRVLGQPGAARIAEGDVGGEILKTAKDCEADLIVMATEGRTGLRRALLGSLTEAVVRRSPVPVLSLRSAKPLRSMLAPVNAQPYSMAGFHYAEDVARALKMPVTMLHVKRGTSQAAAPLRRLELAAAAAETFLGLNVKLKVVNGDPVRKIIEESAKHDLVVLIAHRGGIFRDGLLGTTAEQVLRRSRAPVLSVPTPTTAAAATPIGRRSRKMRGQAPARLASRRAGRRGRWISWKA